MKFQILKNGEAIGFVEWEITNRAEHLGRLVAIELPSEYAGIARQIGRSLRQNGLYDDPIAVIGGSHPPDASLYLEAIGVAIERAIEGDDELSYRLPAEATFDLPSIKGVVR